MATLGKEQILEAIAGMTVLEVSELVKAMEEKTEFTVVLKSFDAEKKIPVIKEVRAITGLGLKEAKELVEAGDKPVKEGISKDEAAKIKQQLETAGGKVDIQ